MKKIIVAVGAAVAVTAGSWTGYSLLTPDTITVKGAISFPHESLIDKSFLNDGPQGLGEPCAPPDGYDDITRGAQVVVKNIDRQTVAVGELRSGTVKKVGVDGDATLTNCSFPFTVEVEPDGSDFYTIHVGNEARGEVEFTEAQLRRKVNLSLG